MVVETGSPGTPLTSQPSSPGDNVDATSGSGVIVPQADVFDVEMPSSNTIGPTGSSAGISELVSVEVSDSLAPAVSTAAAADQVSLVLLPRLPSAHGPGSGSAAP